MLGKNTGIIPELEFLCLRMDSWKATNRVLYKEKHKPQQKQARTVWHFQLWGSTKHVLYIFWVPLSTQQLENSPCDCVQGGTWVVSSVHPRRTTAVESSSRQLCTAGQLIGVWGMGRVWMVTIKARDYLQSTALKEMGSETIWVIWETEFYRKGQGEPRLPRHPHHLLAVPTQHMQTTTIKWKTFPGVHPKGQTLAVPDMEGLASSLSKAWRSFKEETFSPQRF